MTRPQLPPSTVTDMDGNPFETQPSYALQDGYTNEERGHADDGMPTFFIYDTV